MEPEITRRDSILFIYPLSLVFGFTLLFEAFSLFDKLDKVGTYLLGIMAMYLSSLLIYFAFLDKKEVKEHG